MGQTMIMTALMSLVIFMVACSAPKSEKNAASSSSSLSDGAALMGKVGIVVKRSDGSVAYSDSAANSGLVLTAGQTYNFQLSVERPQPGATYSLQSTQTNVVSGAVVTMSLNLGDNQLVIPSNGQGEYAWKLVVSGANMTSVTKYYIADVQCSNPTFTQNSLDASKIMVSSTGKTNLYNLAAAGVDASANGTGPYLCAWDQTGTGIQDTSFRPCNTAVSNMYINYVQNRNIGLLVKDACFTTHAVSRLINLPSTTPSMPGNVFISGVNSAAMGSAAGDSRVDGVNYLATNSGGNNIVQPHYGGGAFKITAAQNYGMPSSVNFGMQIEVQGIVDNLDIKTMTGTIDASAATIRKVTYSTDQAGDQRPATSFSTSACTLSNQGATAKFTQGTPCSVGTTGSNVMLVIEVWGHYSCRSVSNATGSVTIEGDFDGYVNIADNCVGGGGQGGGGIVPIDL